VTCRRRYGIKHGAIYNGNKKSNIKGEHLQDDRRRRLREEERGSFPKLLGRGGSGCR
jgi:hypothetical protein